MLDVPTGCDFELEWGLAYQRLREAAWHIFRHRRC
jgi:hypothetical protein